MSSWGRRSLPGDFAGADSVRSDSRAWGVTLEVANIRADSRSAKGFSKGYDGSPASPATAPASRPVQERAVCRFCQGRERAQDAFRHREGAWAAGTRVRPDHRRQAPEDLRQDSVDKPGQAFRGGGCSPEGG